jgi:hypothetical protein
VILAGGIALIALVPMHLLFSYQMHRAVGSPPFDAVPRYYLPLALSLIPIAVCWSITRVRESLRAVFTRALMVGVAVVPIAILAH